jgi:hypothetical protein
MKAWMKATMAKLSRISDVALAIHFTLERWAALLLFCEEGRAETDKQRRRALVTSRRRGA